MLPGYRSSDTVFSLSSTLATAPGAINAAIKQANSDIGQGNGIVAQACGVANKAKQIGNCRPSQLATPPGSTEPAPTRTQTGRFAPPRVASELWRYNTALCL